MNAIRNDTIEKLKLMFNEVQLCDSKKNSENLNLMLKIIKKISFENFIHVLYPIFLGKKKKFPNKLKNFLRQLFDYLSLDNDSNNIIVNLYNYLIFLSDSKITRVRICSLCLLQLITTVNATDENLYKLTERLFDKDKNVRKNAALILCNYQTFELKNNTKIIDLFKNLLRYDNSNEIRKIIFENIQVNVITQNCILERISDKNLVIRKLFYKNFIEKINLRELEKTKRIDILRKIFSERDFDSVDFFCNACSQYYDLPTEIPILFYDFYDPKYFLILKKLSQTIFKMYDYEITSEEIFKNVSNERILYLFLHLRYVENTKGRDYLNLINLSLFVEFLYVFSKNVDSIEKIESIKILFRMFEFYDVFDEESKRIFYSIVYKLLNKDLSEEILEELIRIVYLIDKQNGDKIFGKLIHKNYVEDTLYCLKICKLVLKYSTKKDLIQEAIINEIVLSEKFTLKNEFLEINDESIENMIMEILFYYLLLDKNDNILEKFLYFKDKNQNYINYISDLALFYKDNNLIQHTIDLFSEDYKTFIPISKLILKNLITDQSIIYNFIRFSLKSYYNDEDFKIQQYLNIFFYEYLLEDSSALIHVFCSVLDTLEKNENFYITQTLYLIENSKTELGTQKIFYNVCIYLYLYHQDIKNLKKFVDVLFKINIVGAWNRSLTKKIMYCCTQLAKKNIIRKKIGEIINRLIDIDDGEIIDREDLKSVKRDLLLNI